MLAGSSSDEDAGKLLGAPAYPPGMWDLWPLFGVDGGGRRDIERCLDGGRPTAQSSACELRRRGCAPQGPCFRAGESAAP
jgi:hypothetical protein